MDATVAYDGNGDALEMWDENGAMRTSCKNDMKVRDETTELYNNALVNVCSNKEWCYQ